MWTMSPQTRYGHKLTVAPRHGCERVPWLGRDACSGRPASTPIDRAQAASFALAQQSSGRAGPAQLVVVDQQQRDVLRRWLLLAVQALRMYGRA